MDENIRNIGNIEDYSILFKKISMFESQSNGSIQSNIHGNSIHRRFDIIEETINNLHRHINRLEILINEYVMCGSCEGNKPVGRGYNFNDLSQNHLFANEIVSLTGEQFDIEPGSNGVSVKFFVDKITSTVLAELGSFVYRIGVIDLTYQEYWYLTLNDWNVVLNLNSSHIVIFNEKLNIKRIPDYKISETRAPLSWCEMSSFARVQFSTTLPIMVKYNDDILFVGDKLCEEYLNILKRVNKQIGAAIRIDKKFLIIDGVKNTLDVIQTADFRNLQTFCSVAESSNMNMHLEEELKYYSNEYKRFVLSNRPFTILEVDRELIYSFQCIEVYIFENAQLPFSMPQPDHKSCVKIGADETDYNEETLKSLDDWVSIRVYGIKQTSERSVLSNDDLMYDDDDDDDDIAFFSKLFIDRTVSSSDEFSMLIHSDDELDSFEVWIQFFVEKISSTPQVRCQNVEYCIGFLDLTEEEYIYMSMIKWTVELSIKTEHIQIRRNKLHIKRIKHVSSKQSIAPDFGRIQFSTTEPLMAKYDGEIYFVGNKLYAEYINILDRIKKCTGTAIQIEKNIIMIDSSLQILNISDSISFESRRILCLSADFTDSKKYLHEHSSNKYRRFSFGSNDAQAHTLFEVDPKLIYSSECDEICVCPHGTMDFGYDKFEWILFKVETEETFETERNEEDFGFGEDDEKWIGKLRMRELPLYEVHWYIKDLVANKMTVSSKYDSFLEDQYIQSLGLDGNLRENCYDYIQGNRTMIHFEEEEQTHYLQRFNQKNIELTYHMDNQFYISVTDELNELAAAVEDNLTDRFMLKPKYMPTKKLAIQGQILGIKEQKIYIDISTKAFDFVKKHHKMEFYDIFFQLNRIPYQLQHYALSFLHSENIFDILINNAQYSESLQPIQRNMILDYKGTLLGSLNCEQQLAVKNMITKVDKLPYVLYGPPGTGKTRTLAALIEQILRLTSHYVLVCAMTNAACDVITDRLLDVLKKGELYRLYNTSCKYRGMNERIKEVSNLNFKSKCTTKTTKQLEIPELSYLYTFRVLICTSSMAGFLTRARENRKWSPSHFGYVIIDECASSPEPVSLIPIAGLCTSYGRIHAQIILAGDPRQLDAVCRSKVSARLGYKKSLLEHLCDTNLYSRNKQTGQFNEYYITQLVKNYRSHPELLRIPNELFYENTLEPMAKQSDIDWYIDSNILPSKQFPMIFKSIQGQCRQSIDGSWFNDDEIETVILAIRQLLPPQSREHGLREIKQSDIGIVTPYRKQRRRIVQRLRRLKYNEITVGTAEVFQGKEKAVILITTVRSDGRLGFVSEPRRFNVIITRAKCLLVIIGDPHTLQFDMNWLRIIEYCIQNNSFLQGERLFELEKVAEFGNHQNLPFHTEQNFPTDGHYANQNSNQIHLARNRDSYQKIQLD